MSAEIHQAQMEDEVKTLNNLQKGKIKKKIDLFLILLLIPNLF